MNFQAPFSQSTIPDNHKKKMAALIGLGIIGFLIIVIIISSILSGGNSTSLRSIGGGNKELVQVTPVTPNNEWGMFVSTQYEIQYPPTWRVEEYFSESGEGVIILPTTLPTGILSPKVSVEVVSTSELSLESRISSLRSGGFTETPYRSGDIVGYQFSHVLPFKPANGQILDTPIKETFIVFEKDGNLFTIGYEHDQEGAMEVADLEKKIIGTFKLL